MALVTKQMLALPAPFTLSSPHFDEEDIMALSFRGLWPVAAVAAVLSAALVFQWHAMNVHAQETMAANADETLRNEAGVMALENHWSIAELSGDTDWLQQMLLPEYRSVNTDGSAHSKEAIVAGAAKRKGTDTTKAQLEFATYRKEHPYGSAVVIHDNTAVISFYDPTLGPQKGVKSSDIFVYLDGCWHALYSQHTGLHG
jgi:hypothetical protein